MDVIHYAGDSVLTGSEIARALLAYAQALASREDSANVEIPIRHADGSLGRAGFLIGPASQLVTETVSSDLPELVDDEVVAALDAAAKQLGGARARAMDAADYLATGADDLDIP